MSSPFKGKLVTQIRLNRLSIAGLEQTFQDNAIAESLDKAVKRFSRDRPRLVCKEYNGNGNAGYPLPADWSEEFSYIQSVNFWNEDEPYDQNLYNLIEADGAERAIDNVASGAVTITLSTASNGIFFKANDVISIINNALVAETNYVQADGSSATGVVALRVATAAAYSTSPKIKKVRHLRFADRNPSATEIFKLHYSIPWVVSDSENTIPENMLGPVLDLATAYSAFVLAVHAEKTKELIELGKSYFAMYEGLATAGEGAKQKTIAGAFADLDAKTSAGQQFFWRNARFR